MSYDKRTLSIRALHIILGVVIFIESLLVAVNYELIIKSDHMGLPGQVVLGLAIIEIAGAILFLIPQAIKIGTYVLLAVFLAAMSIHVLHGQYNTGGLLIYAAAVVAVRYQLQGVKNEG